jgi:DNA repair exonuclease SbcCD nuclease subunit
MTDEFSILCTADLHLGRHPTRIPNDLDGQHHSPKTVWRSIVDLAIERTVDAVVISGDVVDRENRFIEAYGPFENGVRNLAEADISTIVVSGNHDFDILPRLVGDLDTDRLRLLGRGEDWERLSLPDPDEPLIHIDGWSFAHEHVHESPLEKYDLESAAKPVIGVLHADYGVPDSDYAPVTQEGFETASPDAWMLGHIHTPGVRNDRDPLVFYPGAPQPLHPGEPGEHGAWILEIDTTGGISTERIPQASVRYEPFNVDVAGIEDWQDVIGIVRSEIDEHIADRVATRALEVLAVRLELTGRNDCHGDLVANRAALEEDLALRQSGLQIRIEDLSIETKPAVDIEALAGDDTPVGYLADLLVTLEQESFDAIDSELRESVLDAVNTAYTASAYTPLRQEGRISTGDRTVAVDHLDEQARLLLLTLIEQQEPTDG